MGTKNQPMFPKGVVYEGVSEEPTFYRGESGANDSIIPTCDNLFELTSLMPSNPLTEILKDFRTYRPGMFRVFANLFSCPSCAGFLLPPLSCLKYSPLVHSHCEETARHACVSFFVSRARAWSMHP